MLLINIPQVIVPKKCLLKVSGLAKSCLLLWNQLNTNNLIHETILLGLLCANCKKNWNCGTIISQLLQPPNVKKKEKHVIKYNQY